eukprot:CAMPEP_0172541746 /NCGR_PEP_ID=MMETSP1067-20121228/12510_1 /TAXON_ID=265564 ORGANISM="Thalassiosira punctigera, Strain Tpunct2005C2" /NCGR_SAMPLE_ID=MMETSP1067 /ASSEMBLY_ACC=CAM_ASM_000444 /LENGTH=295 /DNA_ID=CAMNT_0013327849 /DNA_START=78 /DNA_END=965 /DNA_ORIENTATION=-
MTVSEHSDKNESLDGGIAVMAEPLLPAPVQVAVPTDVPVNPLVPAIVEVVAPSTLPEGYTFEAVANGRNFTVTVPAGGVQRGQRFAAPLPPAGGDAGAGSATPRPTTPGYQAPTGHWKDSLCDCCQPGCCHASLWNAYFCPLVLVGQINNRLKLTWLGPLGNVRALLAITIIYYIIDATLSSIDAATVIQTATTNSTAGQVKVITTGSVVGQVNNTIGLLWAVFVLILICQTRQLLRARYDIPEQSCQGCEDCCCAYWCSCCTVAQMARHTADYETYVGVCCSDTGLPPHAPEIV